MPDAVEGLPRPYGKTLLVYVPPQAGEQQVGSLVVLASATEEPLIGEVLGVGDEILNVALHSRVGFSKYAGTVFTIAGFQYHVIRAEDILVVWEPTAVSPLRAVSETVGVYAGELVPA